MNIEIFPDATTVAQEAASFIAAEARAAVAQRGRFVMAVSGGKTPWIMLRALANEKVPWENVHIFQVDERIAPTGSTDRNLTHLQESLLSHVPLKPEQIYAMPVEEADFGAAVKKYAHLIESVTGFPILFDLVHLGLGPDGHTASLIPEDAVLKVIDRDVAITGVYQNHQRMTLTYPAINRSRKILWVVTGAEKTEALSHLLNRETFIPGGVVEQSRATLFADASAAGSLDLSLWKESSRSVGIASDHGGFELKEELIKRLQFSGYLVTDFGASSLVSEDDYPDYVIPLARAVAKGTVARGIAICGSGVGVTVCANKIKGVRASLIQDHFSAKQGVEDDHINILCMGGRTTGLEVAWDLVQTYLQSNYSRANRHLRRLSKVDTIS
ncbi:MAG: 6-phosphogluconolactonase [Chthoniobacterales bacterium]